MNHDISHDLIEIRTTCPIMKVKEDKLMTITATEFKKNLGKYLDSVTKDGIIITKNGKVIAILKAPDDIAEKIAWLDSIVGIANPEGKEFTDEDIDRIRHERLEKKYGPFN